MLYTSNVNHLESITERFFFEVTQAIVWDVQRSVFKHVEEGFVIDCNQEVVASKDKMPGVFERVDHSQCFPFNRGVSRLCCVGEPAPHERNLPSSSTAEGFQIITATMLLEQPIAESCL